MSFLRELRRRNVFKVGAAYAIVTWLLIQIAGAVLPTFDAPRWVLQTVTFLLILGFPVAVILAWAYEATPEGIKPTSGVSKSDNIAPVTGKKLDYVVIVLMALAIGFLVVDNYVLEESTQSISTRQETASSAAPDEADESSPAESGARQTTSQSAPAAKETGRNVLENSVAVLPFDNFSPDPDDAYFAAGIHEEILNQLVKLRNLHVIARTTMGQYAGTDKSIREIAAELNVETVMEGSVRYAADRVRVTTQLIDPLTGAHLWSETYEREFEDIFAIESDIAMQVANALGAEFSPVEQARIESVPTDSPEAYALYLSAEVLRARQTQDDIALGLEHIDRAIELDPEFALGWVEKSFLHNVALIFFPERVAEERLASVQALRHALELDPELPQAHAGLAFVDSGRADWRRAEDGFSRALALGMSAGEIARYQAPFRFAVGDIERAHEITLAWQARDPLDPTALFFLFVQLDVLGDARAALAEYERGKRLFDEWPAGHFNAMASLLGNGEHERAKELAQNEVSDAVVVAVLPYFDKPKDALAELQTLYANDAYADPLSRLAIAVLAAYFDDQELALKAVTDSINAFAVNAYILWTPLFRELRQEASFKDFLRRKGLIAYWREYGWPDLCHRVGSDDFECS
jgi:TolB-like protein